LSDDAGLVALLEQAIPELVRAAHVPGLSLAIARGDVVVWEAGFGYADIGARRPMTPETVFRSGSMAKVYTATAVMQLVETGLVELDGTVSDYVGFPVVNPLGERDVTVDDLLTHRSGLSSNVAHSTLRPPPPLAEHLRADFERGKNESYRGAVPKWSAPVGAAVQYSNSGMALLGLIVERSNPDGLTYGTYVGRHILEPLGMNSSCCPDGDFDDPAQVPADVHERIGTGYVGWGPLNVASPKIWFADFPAGLLLSIPREHIRLLLAFLNGGVYLGRRLLREDTVRSMLEPRAEISGVSGASMVALAWMRGDLGAATEWFGHGGAHMWGWRNEFRAYPNLDLAVVVATNRWDLARTSSLSPECDPTALIVQLAADHVASGGQSPARSWAWKRSYALGLNFAAANRCYLGMDESLSEAQLEAMAAQAFDGPVGFDRDGFRAALADTSDANFSVAGLDAFLDSDRCRLTRAELDAVWADAGGVGAFPFPVARPLRTLFESGRTR